MYESQSQEYKYEIEKLSNELLNLKTVVLEKTLESPLGSKEIEPVNLKEISLNIHWKD